MRQRHTFGNPSQPHSVMCKTAPTLSYTLCDNGSTGMQIQVAFNLLTPSAMAVVDLFLSTKRSSLPFFTIIFSIADASNPSVMIVQADSICRHTFAKNSDMNTRSSQRRWCRRCRRTCPMHTESVHFLRVQQRKPKKRNKTEGKPPCTPLF